MDELTALYCPLLKRLELLWRKIQRIYMNSNWLVKLEAKSLSKLILKGLIRGHQL